MITHPIPLSVERGFTKDHMAYMRALASIPLARETYQALTGVEGPLSPQDAEWVDKQAVMTAMYEARYLMTDALLEASGITQVLELGSGFSPRGLVFCRANPEATYVELDLADKMAKKIQLVANLCDPSVASPVLNLHLLMGNATMASALERCVRHFTPTKPVAVITEGLLQYLSWPNKDNLTRLVRGVLQQYGGVWITPDIGFQSRAFDARPETAEKYDHTHDQWELTLRQNLFSDTNHAISYFEEAGYEVGLHEHTAYVGRLKALENAPIDDDIMRDRLSQRYTFMMKIRE